MSITDPMVLPPDVIITPVEHLPMDIRSKLAAEKDDYALTRPRTRVPSNIIDRHTAALLQEFRQAKTIVQAVISYSRTHKLDPERTLEQAFPALQRLLSAHFLVPSGSSYAEHIASLIQVGTKIDSFEVTRSIQVLEDTELYQVRDRAGEFAALKIARSNNSKIMKTLHHEASILQRLDGRVNPTWLANGLFEDRPYLAMTWCPGVPVSTFAQKLRGQHGLGPEGIRLLGNLCCSVVEAYSHLHSQQVIHGDVHPGNILVRKEFEVNIVDYGLARFVGSNKTGAREGRGGVPYFFEPEFAKARLERTSTPRVTHLSEQYAVGALLYLLLTGQHYCDFAAETLELYRQITEEPPRCFDLRGVHWPDVEALVARALSKKPHERFPSMRGLLEQLREVQPPRTEHKASPKLSTLDWQAARALVDSVLKRMDVDNQLYCNGLPEPPYCSVNYGAAGIAFALNRISEVRQDAKLLSLADLWITRAISRANTDQAFYNTKIKITEETVGRSALYHTSSGIHLVRAIVSHALGDFASQQIAFDDFVKVQTPCKNLDLTLGISGVLLGCSMLADLPTNVEWLDRQQFLAFGDRVFAQLWKELGDMPVIGESRSFSYLGIAHGWAGILYATLCWCQSHNRDLPAGCEARLAQLAECGEAIGSGMRWKVRIPRGHRNTFGSATDEYMTSWCNGSPGYVFLWSLASNRLRNQSYFALAEKAGIDSWENCIDFDSLCCGLAGSAYAMLNLYRSSGDRLWLQRAESLANRAVLATKESLMPDSLYKGTLGVAVLIEDLSDPTNSRMPLFESEYRRM